MKTKHSTAVLAGLGMLAMMGTSMPVTAFAAESVPSTTIETPADKGDAAVTEGEAYVTVDGEKTYGTLKDLVESAKPGTPMTVTLADDVELTTAINVPTGTEVHVIGDGHAVTLNGTKVAFTGAGEGVQQEGMPENVNLSVDGVTFVSATEGASGYAVLLDFNSFNTKVTLNGCTFKNLYTAVYANPITEAPTTDNVVPTIAITNSVYDGTSYGYSFDNVTSGSFDVDGNVTFEGNKGLDEGHDNEDFDNLIAASVINSDGTIQNYRVVSDAIAAADDGETVKLRTDVNECVVVNKKITLDGNGHKVTAASGDAITVTAGGVTLTGVNAVSEKGFALTTGGDPTTSRIEDGITVDGGSYASSDSGMQGMGTIRLGVNGKVTVKDTHVTGSLQVFTDTVPVVEGNTVSFSKTDSQMVGILVYGVAADDYDPSALADANTIGIPNSSSDYAQVGSEWSTIEKVPGATSVATIGDNAYRTMQDAIDAFVDGDVITVTTDTDETVVVSHTGSFTLDVKDGVKFNATITVAEGFSMVVDGNVYTIKEGVPSSELTPATRYYKVKFDYMTKALEDVTVNVDEGESVAKPDDPKLDGFVFNGWFLDPEGTEAYDFDTPVTENITLYANWGVAGTDGGDENVDKPATDDEKKPVDDATEEKDDLIQTGVEYVAPAAAGIGSMLAGIGAFMSRRFGRRE